MSGLDSTSQSAAAKSPWQLTRNKITAAFALATMLSVALVGCAWIIDYLGLPHSTKLLMVAVAPLALVGIIAILFVWESFWGIVKDEPVRGFTRRDADVLVSLACGNFPDLSKRVRCRKKMAIGLGIAKNRLCSTRWDADQFATRIIVNIKLELERLKIFDELHLSSLADQAVLVHARWGRFDSKSKDTLEHANELAASTSISMPAITDVGQLLESVADELVDWAMAVGKAAQPSQADVNSDRRDTNSKKLEEAIGMVHKLIAEIDEIERYCQNQLLSAVLGAQPT